MEEKETRPPWERPGLTCPKGWKARAVVASLLNLSENLSRSVKVRAGVAATQRLPTSPVAQPWSPPTIGNLTALTVAGIPRDGHRSADESDDSIPLDP